MATSASVGDPVWRLPLWAGYDAKLDSQVADMNNVWEAPFAGSIIAALFLKRFAKNAQRFAHFDLFGWRPLANALGPRAASRRRRAPCSPFSPRSSADERYGARQQDGDGDAVRLDPRRNVFRPDLAAKSLYGKVSAPNYVQGFRRRWRAPPCRCAAVPRRRYGFETEALFGETRHRLRRARRLGAGCSSSATATSATCRSRRCRARYSRRPIACARSAPSFTRYPTSNRRR